MREMVSGSSMETARRLRRRSVAGSVILIAAILAVALPVTMRARPAKARPPAPDEMVARGQYLVTITGCNDCHTPMKMGDAGPEPDMERMLSGHPESFALAADGAMLNGPWIWAGAATNTAFVGPWGLSFATNLTPHENTGIGIWSEDIFIKTLRTGRHWGAARPILPPMPWPAYAQMSDEDLRAVYAYLRTVPPIQNRVPEAQVAAG